MLCEPGAGLLDGTVSLVEDTGPEVFAYLDTAAGRLCAAVGAGTQCRRGDHAGIRLQTDAWHLFDTDSGQRIAARH